MSTIDLDVGANTDNVVDFDFFNGIGVASIPLPGIDNNKMLAGNLDPSAPLEVNPTSTSSTLPSGPVMHPHPQLALVDNEFVEQYRESIKPVIELIEKQISRAKWCGTNFQVHSFASDEWLGDISAELRKIIPSVQDFASINRGNMNKFCELVDVKKCHSRCGDYLVQFSSNHWKHHAIILHAA